MSYLDDLFGLSGKIALVTGGGSGIGTMMAHALSKAGAKVYIASRKLQALEVVAADINNAGGNCIAIEADLSTAEGIEALASAISEREEKLDILINNSGTTWGAPYGEFPFEAWQRVMTINVSSGFHLTQALTPLLKKSGSMADPSRVIFTGSVMGTRAMTNQAYSYSPSKAAVHHMTKMLAHELAKENITVNCIAPGPFPSKMMKHVAENEKLRKISDANTPLGRMGEPDDIAGVLLPLVSKGGAYVTGAIVPVDGGISANP